MNTDQASIPGVSRAARAGLVIGVVALVLLVVLGLRDPVQFFRSYLFGFVFWVGLPLGCAGIWMLHNLIGGTWGFPLRRIFEAGTRTFMLMAIASVPILFRLRELFAWADPAKVAVDPLLQHKHPYLNVPFFIGRTVFYFAFWILVTSLLTKWSRQQDETGEAALTSRMKRLSAPALLLLELTVTFSAIDWVMSLEPHWSSTIYGMIFIVTQALAAMSVMTFTIIRLCGQKSLAGLVTPKLLNDYGNLLLVFTMLWAYLSFDQFLIIWAGNLREEIPWYMSRAFRGWGWIGVALIVFHFAIPFLLLLSRYVKRRATIMTALSAWLLIVSIIDIFWLLTPAFSPAAPAFHPTDWLAILGLGGLWLWQFATQLQGRPLLPLHDPRLKELMQHA